MSRNTRQGWRRMGTSIVLCIFSICIILQDAFARALQHNPSSLEANEHGNTVRGTVFCSPHGASCSVQLDVIDRERGHAVALYTDAMETTGWGKLSIVTNNAFSDDEQAYAAGYLEGYLTAERIRLHYENAVRLIFGKYNNSMPEAVANFFRDQEHWSKGQVRANPQSPFWQHVGLIFSQFDGLVAGYNANSPLKPLNNAEIQVMTAFGDLFDIVPHVIPSERPSFEKMSKDELLDFVHKNSHCSGFVTPDLSDIFSGHCSWFDYGFATRIFKYYHFQFRNPQTASRKVGFSSYPATLSSNDDFYVTEQSLNVIETTNNIFDTKLYEKVSSHALLTWQRAILANYLAKDGESWTDIFSQHNSGTYNNQYFVVDYKKFNPGSPLQNGTLWVIEQIPGFTERADISTLLGLGYFPSYNVPYFKTIWEKSGYPVYEQKFGPELSWSMAPRAQIFRDRAHKVHDMKTMKQIMRYNEWETDPLAHMNPGNAISSRFDLQPDPHKRSAAGAYDAKVTSFGYIQSLLVEAVSGPTTEGQPPFQFSNGFESTPHQGLPDIFAFDWELMRPETPT